MAQFAAQGATGASLECLQFFPDGDRGRFVHHPYRTQVALTAESFHLFFGQQLGHGILLGTSMVVQGPGAGAPRQDRGMVR